MEDDKKDILKPQNININFKPEDIQVPKRFLPIEGTSIKAKIINLLNRLDDMIYNLFEGMESIPRIIWEHIRILRDHFNLTILLTSHYIEEIQQLADRVA